MSAPAPTRTEVRHQLWLSTLAALTHPQVPMTTAITQADAALAAYDRTFPAPEPLKVSGEYGE